MEQEQQLRTTIRNRKRAMFIILLIASVFSFIYYMSEDHAGSVYDPSEEAQNFDQIENPLDNYFPFVAKFQSAPIQKTNEVVIVNNETINDENFIANNNQSSKGEIAMDIFRLLAGKQVSALWTKEGDVESQFGVFKNNKGSLAFQIHTYSQYYEEAFIPLTMNIYDGIYRDEYSIILKLKIFEQNISKFTDSGVILENFLLDITTKKALVTQSQLQQYFNVSIEFGKEEFSGMKGGYDQPKLSLKFQSKEGQVNFQFNLIFDNIDQEIAQAMTYSIFATTMAVIHFATVIKIIKNMIGNEHENQKYSLASLGFIFIWDGFLCLLHIFASIVNDVQLFSYYATPAFIYLVLWIVFERSLIVYVWKCRNEASFDTAVEMRKSLLKFYAKLYISMILAIFFVSQFIMSNWFLILINLYLVPQIVHQAIRGQIQVTDNAYICGLMVLRSALPIYVKGCPDNIFGLHPYPSVVVAIVFLVMIQMLIVYLQNYYGARFFLPSYIMGGFNYFHKMPENFDVEKQTSHEFNDDCVICMNPLHSEPHMNCEEGGKNESNPYLKRIKNKKNQIMKSPCNHKFHIVCLVDWMSIKMECPTCRQTLPAIV